MMRQSQINNETFVHCHDVCDWMTQNIECIAEYDPKGAALITELAASLRSLAEEQPIHVGAITKTEVNQ